MSGKQIRQENLVNILQSQDFSKQHDVVAAMQAKGFQVTQASISRDFFELGIVKIGGVYSPLKDVRTSKPSNPEVNTILSIETAGDALIVLKTSIGSASVVALAIDNSDIKGIAGTIAGDDTVFIAIKNKSFISSAIKEIKTLEV